MRRCVVLLAVVALLAPAARAQIDHHHHHHMMHAPAKAPPAGASSDPIDHSSHQHDVGPAGSTYDLRWLDAMVQHHTGALRMSEFVFGIGAPGVGALGRDIWREQAQEIKAMRQWRKAWYPAAPIYPVALKPGGDPNAMADLIRMSPAQIQAMQMMGSIPTKDTRVHWFLEGMIAHHGGALLMAHDALEKSRNPTIQLLAQEIILGQSDEIFGLRKMLLHDGLNKPEYYNYDALFTL